MFVDLVGSTALSARLDPEDMSEVLRAYQNAVAGEIARFEGHVAKFMGDGVLAYFGWPQRARGRCRAGGARGAGAIAAAVGRLTAPDGEALAARVGIATGLVVVGDLVGEGAAQEEAVVGETPNLAARLQGWPSPGRGDRRGHAAAARRAVRARGSRRTQQLKGFAEPVPAGGSWASERSRAGSRRCMGPA